MTPSPATRSPTRPRRIAAVTVARSDYGICLPVYKKILACEDLQLQLIVTGAHLSLRYGSTIDQIRNDGLPIAATIDMLANDTLPDTPAGVTTGVANAIPHLATTYEKLAPDILLVLGDRFEMAAAVLAAQPFGIPVAHIHGGEISLGAIDDALRHAITKMSCLHFVSHPDHARRVIQMGASPAHVIVTGAPGLDHLHTFTPLTIDQLSSNTNLTLDGPFAVVVFHPVTRQPGLAQQQMQSLLTALQQSNLPCIIGYPNADAGNHPIIHLIQHAVAQNPHWQTYKNMPIEHYYSLLSHAAVLVGNSSSGIIEAASFKLPVVNVGDRQKGRLHAHNVIDTPCDAPAIAHALQLATSPRFRHQLHTLTNPYGDGRASDRITHTLRHIHLNPALTAAPFHDLPPCPPASSTSQE